MAGEKNQMYWRGIRPTDPAENIPVDIKVITANVPVQITGITGNMPVDVKAHTINTPVDVKSHAVNTPVDVKSMTGNMPVDIKAHTVQTPVDIKAHTVNTPIVPSTPPQNIPVEVMAMTGEVTVKDSWLLQGNTACSLADPLDDAIVLDTGPLTEGYYDFMVSIGSNIDHNYWKTQHRNATNSADIGADRFVLKAYYQHTFHINNRYLAANERLRIEQRFDLTGRFYGSIWWTKRA